MRGIERNNKAAKTVFPSLRKFGQRAIMEDTSVQKSCWGLTIKAVAGIALAMAVAWLITGSDGLSKLAGG
ncbi:MAG: hypothetical protein JNL61_17605 [Rhizobiaceae bacterium]|nr:hypothetical protein [Rhizobiaceae bacterium]